MGLGWSELWDYKQDIYSYLHLLLGVDVAKHNFAYLNLLICKDSSLNVPNYLFSALFNLFYAESCI